MEQVASRARECSDRQIVTKIAANRAAFHRPSQMARAAAAEVEQRERAIAITIGKDALHIAVDLVVKHIIMVKYLVINRPLIKKLPDDLFTHGFASLAIRLKERQT